MSCKGTKLILKGGDEHYSSTSNVAKENGRKFTVDLRRNNATFCKIKYDKGIYQNNDKRCDFLFTISKNAVIEDWLFVELKGQDIKEAVLQISNTIDQIGSNTLKDAKVSAFIVSSKSPRAARFDIIKAKESFRKKYRHLNATLDSQNSHYICTVS